MKRKINITHIDTGGHGYYSISKKDVALLGIQEKVTGYSGHNLSRMYLEEDCDAGLVHKAAKEKDIQLNIKQSYNLYFKTVHNYKPELFDYFPSIGDTIAMGSNSYVVTEIHSKKMILRCIYSKNTPNYVNKLSFLTFDSMFLYITEVTNKKTK